MEKDRHIRELYELKHRNDNLKNTGVDYENKLVEKMTSGYLLHNDTTYEFLGWLQKLAIDVINSNLILRNFWNYNVVKYYDKHNN